MLLDKVQLESSLSSSNKRSTSSVIENKWNNEGNKLVDNKQRNHVVDAQTAKFTFISNSKVMNDPVHGHIEIPSLCISILDTPQFQRLRNLKQLGSCYWVFPGASHNRFEHSIGVCHLAGELAKNLQRQQPELEITDADVLCVQIAGLCHDLGHGPFSHLFEHFVIHALDPNSTWSHENASIMMLDHLIKSNNLWPAFKKNDLTKIDILFIKEMIYGLLPSEHYECFEEYKEHETSSQPKRWRLKGRSEDKRYLYEIVANKRNGIDVDKFDYFSRDCHHLNIKNNFDHIRWIKFARVIKVDGQLQLCTRDKEVSNLYDLFSTRHSLHRRAYQHKVVKIMDNMIGEILKAANDHLLFYDSNGNQYKMSEAIFNMDVYQQLTDSILERIHWSRNPRLEEAQKILMDVHLRRLYRNIGRTTLAPKHLCLADLPEANQQLADICNSFIWKRKSSISTFVADDLVIDIVDLDYGKKSKNPIDYVRFYTKSNPNFGRKIRKDHVSQMLPENFSERFILVFCKRRDLSSVAVAKEAFQEWARQKRLPAPIYGDSMTVNLTQTEEISVT